MKMKKNHKCYHCGYYKNGYCNDLDERVDPDYPECSEEYYNS
jgi:hypothetical protein